MEESAMNTTWAAALDDAPRSANLKASVSPPHETVKATLVIPSEAEESLGLPGVGALLVGALVCQAVHSFLHVDNRRKQAGYAGDLRDTGRAMVVSRLSTSL